MMFIEMDSFFQKIQSIVCRFFWQFRLLIQGILLKNYILPPNPD